MKIITKVLVVLFWAILLLAPVRIQAQQPIDPICSQAPANNKPAVCDQAKVSKNTPAEIINKVTRIIAIVTGTMSVLFVMIGGFKYITSTGDAQKVNSAKNTIMYALIGLGISAFAPFIVGYAIKALT